MDRDAVKPVIRRIQRTALAITAILAAALLIAERSWFLPAMAGSALAALSFYGIRSVSSILMGSGTVSGARIAGGTLLALGKLGLIAGAMFLILNGRPEWGIPLALGLSVIVAALMSEAAWQWRDLAREEQ